MNEENKTIFDSVEAQHDPNNEGTKVAVEQPEQQPAQATPSLDDPELEDVEDIEVPQPRVSDKSEQEIADEYGVKKSANGRTLTIKEVGIKPPKVQQLVNGVKQRIEPKTTQSGRAQYYPSKLFIRFEEDNIVEYYPGINFWVNDGKISDLVKINREGNTVTSQIFRKALQKMSSNAFKLETVKFNNRVTEQVTDDTKPMFQEFSKNTSDKQVFDWMIGKKVVIETDEGVFEGRKYFRNDIKEFVV